MRRISIIVVSIILFGQSKSQTCIVYKKEKDRIYIGADRRMLFYKTDSLTQKTDTIKMQTCKISVTNKIICAGAGYMGNLCLDKASEICARSKTVDSAYLNFIREFGQSVANRVDWDKQYRPEFFKNKFHGDTPVINTTLFFSYENKILKGKIVKFYLLNRPSLHAIVGDTILDIDSIGVMGIFDEITQLFADSLTWDAGAIHGIKKLIDIEIEAHPNEVGDFVDILMVTDKNRTKWKHHKKCSPIAHL